MKLSAETLEILAETSHEAKDVFGEWGHIFGVTFLVSDDCGVLHISVLDA